MFWTEIRLSQNYKEVNRVYTNIYDAFSLIGGMASTIFGFIGIGMIAYNEYRLQADIIQNLETITSSRRPTS